MANCPKCGHEVDGNSPICMYCGAALSESTMTPELKQRLAEQKTDTYKAPNASSTRALGAFLIILGILADVISMFLIFSSSYGAFSVLTIGGTICFLVGLVLFRHG